MSKSHSEEIVTVLIPTRERADTLVHCLKTVVSQPNPNIEIIVSDNFSGPEVKSAVDKFIAQDSRVKYVRTPERLGMSEHWNWAVEHITGDWVTILGDDDGLLPNGIDNFFALHEKHPKIEAITCVNCFFRWPSEGNNDGKLVLMGGSGYEVRDSRATLQGVLDGKFASLPTIYTGGFVSMNLFNRIKAKSPNKQFFQSIIPDVYSGVAMSSVTDKYIYCWEPWFVAGSSKHSNGRQHVGKTQKEMQKLDFHTESQMKFLPSLGDGTVMAIQIMIYEGFLRSQYLRDYDMNVELKTQLELCILQSSRATKQQIIEYCRDVAQMNDINFDEVIKNVKKKSLSKRLKKLGRKFLRHIPGFTKIHRKVISDNSVRNVDSAAIRFSKELN